MAICASCGKETAKVRCSRCKSSFYCNVSCQRKDWHLHKPLCKLPNSPLILQEVPTLSSSLKKLAPKPEDFPLELQSFSYSSSGDGVDSNLLILLHGLGDSHKNFFALGQKMALPQTAILAISGPIKFPEEILSGRAWFTSFDEDWNVLHNDERRLKSLIITRKLLESAIKGLAKYGWARDRIHLLGFSQGGTVALDLALHSCGENRKLGSVVAVSGSILPEFEVSPDDCACGGDCTNVLITHGDQDEVLSRKEVHRTKDIILKVHPEGDLAWRYFDKGHAMIESEEEMGSVMRFWSRVLHRRMVNMEKNATLYEVVNGCIDINPQSLRAHRSFLDVEKTRSKQIARKKTPPISTRL